MERDDPPKVPVIQYYIIELQLVRKRSNLWHAKCFGLHRMERNVTRKAVILGLFLTITLSAFGAEKKSTASPRAQKPATKSKSTRVAQETLRGCVDQRDGNYVLTDDRMLNKVVDLQAVSGGQEAVFAKHLGHKVTVKGSRSPEPDSAVFRVASIEEISEVCSPDPGSR